MTVLFIHLLPNLCGLSLSIIMVGKNDDINGRVIGPTCNGKEYAPGHSVGLYMAYKYMFTIYWVLKFQ